MQAPRNNITARRRLCAFADKQCESRGRNRLSREITVWVANAAAGEKEPLGTWGRHIPLQRMIVELKSIHHTLLTSEIQ